MQKRLQSNIEFRNQLTVSATKFGESPPPRSLWYRQPRWRSLAAKPPSRAPKPTTRPDTLANRTSWEIWTPQEAERGTPPSKNGKPTTPKPKPPRPPQTPDETNPSETDKCKPQNGAPAPKALAPPNRSPGGQTRPITPPKQGLPTPKRSSKYPDVDLNAPTISARPTPERDVMKSPS